jgi:hypothetical protein
MPKYQHEPEPGSREHATLTTLRTYGPDLDKITDAKDRADTIKAMVKRFGEYDRQHDAIGREFGPQIRELAALHLHVLKTDPQRSLVEKKLAAINREWDKRLAPHSTALHKDLDNIVKRAVAPYRDGALAFSKNVQTVGKNLRSRQLADAFKARQQQQQHQPGKDIDRER